MKMRCLIFISLLFPSLMHAAVAPICKPLPFLKGGFQAEKYKRCTTLMNQCPASGALPSADCAKEVGKDAACNQLNKLAEALGTSITQIAMKQINAFRIVGIYFPADGQNHYFILTPKNCLVDTIIDPRKLDKSLEAKYPKTSFIIVNWNEPQFKKSNDAENFTAVLKITDTCMACKVIGWATLKFNFDKNGNYVSVDLVNFSVTEPK